MKTKFTLVTMLIAAFFTQAQTPTMVKDINNGSGGLNTSDLVDVNGTLFLRASDGTNVNGTLFFHANDGTHGKELWKSDGTDAGTVLVKDITAGSADTDLDFFVNVNGILVFTVNDNTNGTELWRSDGTDAGTFLLKDINPGNNDGIGWNLRSDFVVSNGVLYFQAEEPTNGTELWKTDGTTAGTVLIKDIASGNNSADPQYFVVANNTVYFYGQDASRKAIWKTDGTDVGTVSVYTFTPGFYVPAKLVDANGTIFFTINDPFTNGVELWKCDGTSLGTSMVKDINPGITSSNHGNLTNVNGTLFFTADDGTNSTELWKSDGTDAGTTIVVDIVAGVQSSLPASLTVVSSNLFFVANDGTHGKGLWSISGLPSAIEEEKAVVSFSLYPNPSSENLEFRTLNSELNTKSEVQIFDLTGKLIRSETISSNRIDVSELANGLYVLSLNINGKTQQQKFIVQH